MAQNEFLAPRWKNLAVGDSNASAVILGARQIPLDGMGYSNPDLHIHLSMLHGVQRIVPLVAQRPCTVSAAAWRPFYGPCSLQYWCNPTPFTE